MTTQIMGALLAAVSLLPMAAAAQDRGNRGGIVERLQARQNERAARVEQRQETRAERVEQRREIRASRPERAEPRQEMRVPRAEQVEQRRQAALPSFLQRSDQRRMRVFEQRSDGPVARQRRDDAGDAQRQARRDGDRRWSANVGSQPNREFGDRNDRRDGRGDWNDRRGDRGEWYNRSRFNQNDVQQRRAWQDRQGYDRSRNGLDRGSWNGGSWNRGDRDRGSWNRGWRNDRRYDWNGWRQSNRDAYRLPRYYAPYGWNGGYRRFGIGAVLTHSLFAQDYWISDPYSYRLPEAYEPCQWVRYYNDALLVDTYSGEVVDVIEGIFW